MITSRLFRQLALAFAGAMVGVSAFAQPAFSPSPVAFPDTPTNTTSGSITVTVSNPGVSPLTISSLSFAGGGAGFSIATHNCGSSIAPSGSCQVSITFTPTSIGAKTDTFYVTTPIEGVTLQGNGVGKVCQFVPSSGAWNVASNWGGDCAGSFVPGSDDRAEISGGKTVTLPLGNTTIGDLYFGGATIQGADSTSFGSTLELFEANPIAWASGNYNFTNMTLSVNRPTTTLFAISGTMVLTNAVLDVAIGTQVRLASSTLDGADGRIHNNGRVGLDGNMSLVTSTSKLQNLANGKVSVGSSMSISGAGLIDNAGSIEVDPSVTLTLADATKFTQSLTGALQGSGTVSAVSQTLTIDAGELGGSLTLNVGEVHNHGTIRPTGATRNTLGNILITGKLTNATDGVIEILAQSTTGYSSVTAQGTGTTLAGELSIIPINSFVPLVGNAITPVQHAGATGTFGAVTTTGVVPWLPTYNASNVTVTAAAPSSLNISVSAVNFGNVPAGFSAPLRTVTLTNPGAVPIVFASNFGLLDVSYGSSNEFNVIGGAGSCEGLTLTQGNSCTITVSFFPSSAFGSDSFDLVDLLLQGTNASAFSPSSVIVSGNAVTSVLSSTPTILSFANTSVGTASLKQTVTINNSALFPLTISTTSNTPGEFGHYANTCTIGGTIPAQGSCTIDVDFSPLTSSTPGLYNGTLDITTDFGPLIIDLDGTATAYAVAAAPTSLTFGSVAVGSSSSSQVITFTNSGAGTANIESFSTIGPDFTIGSGTCSPASAFGPGTCTASVTFTPQTAGAKSVSLSLNHRSSTGPSITLSGTAIPATVGISPASFTFANTVVGAQSAPQTFTITNNTGVANSVARSVGVNFIMSNDTCVVVPDGGTCTLDVIYQPVNLGSHVGALSITIGAQSNSASLSGLGVAAGVAPAISSGTPSAGTVGQAYNFSFAATGTTPITWSLVSGSLPPGLTLNASTGAVTGTPTSAGTFAFTISASNVAGLVNLSTAISVAPAISSIMSLSTNTLSFGSQNVGVTSAAQVVTITNTGTGPFSVLSFSGIGDFNYTSDCPLSSALLQPNASCNLNVTFTPLVAGAAVGRISVNNNAAQQGTNGNGINLSGTGVTVPRANIVVNPSAGLNFGDQAVGSRSAPVVVFVSNTGQAVLELQSVVTTGTSFSVGIPSAADNPRGHPLCVTGNTVAPGASCAMAVTFGPAGIGALTGRIAITHNATPTGGTGTTNINLTGNGTQVREPLIRVGGTLAFGDQIVGTASDAQAAFITNIGTATLNVTGLTITPTTFNTSATDFTVSGSCGALAPNASCAVGVSFTPTGSVGPKGANLTIVSDATNAPTSTIAVLGNAIPAPAPKVQLNPTTVGFGSVLRGTLHATTTLKVTNSGQLPLTISRVDGIPNATGYSPVSNDCLRTIGVGDFCTIVIRFTPNGPGPQRGELSIISNAPTSPDRVPLTGSGCTLVSPTFRFFVSSC